MEGVLFHPVWQYVALGLTCFAVASSYLQIFCHLRNYTEPALQRYVVRIIFLVPLYAVSSFLCLRFPKYSIYINTPRDCYEAFVIWAFMSLLFAYVGGPGAVVVQAEGRVVKGAWRWMTCCLPTMPVDGTFLRRCKQFVLQFVLLKPVLAVLVLVLYSCRKYSVGSWSWKDSFLYISIAYNLCYSLALYALLIFYLGAREVLEVHQPGSKFLVVKGSIFFPFFMGTAITALAASTPLLPGPYDAEMAQSFSVCAEMAVASLVMWVAFPYRIYQVGGQTVGLRLAAILHSLSIDDVIADAVHQFNPTYESYVLYHDGGPAENVKKAKFRRTGQQDQGDHFSVAVHNNGHGGSGTSKDRKHGAAVQMSRMLSATRNSAAVDGLNGSGPAARLGTPAKMGFVKRMMHPFESGASSGSAGTSGGGGGASGMRHGHTRAISNAERKQAELLDSDSDAGDESWQDNQLDGDLILPRSTGGGQENEHFTGNGLELGYSGSGTLGGQG